MGLLSSCLPAYHPMGPATTDPRIDSNTFVTRDGVRLPVSVWGPRQQPDKVVIGLHSFGEFRDAFALIGTHLAEQNIALWAYDQRGFGDGPHRGFWAGKNTMVQDFQDFTGAVRTVVETNVPLVFMGESMGAAVVLAAVARDNNLNPQSLILSGPGVRENRPNRYWFNAGLWLATRVVSSYEADVPRTFDDRLADYHAKRWAEDPKIIDKVRADTYFGLIRLSDLASDTADAVTVPTLILFGTEDTQIHPNSVCALKKRLGSQATLRVFEKKPHLMFQISEQDQILSLIDDWLTAPDNVSPSDDNLLCAS